MDDFSYYLPVNLEFGCGKIKLVGKICAKYGDNACIVTGKGGSVKRSGALERVLACMKSEHIAYKLFDQVEPNPTTTTVYKGVELAKQAKCNVIIALGGGSTIDCAKSMAFSLCNEGDLFAYILGHETGSKALPIIAIPTTCGTGSEANSLAVITDTENCNKKSLKTPLIVPAASIIDPELMRTMPPHILASVAFDALCHNMEAYLSRACQPLVEIQALYGIKLFYDYFFRAYEDKEDMDAWSAMALASTLGGINIHCAGTTAPHGLEHPASGIRNITHGRGLAALIANIYKKSIKWAPKKFATIACTLGGKDENDYVPIIEGLLVRMGLNTTLSKEGVQQEDIKWMTKNALRISMAGIIAHPRVFTRDEICEIYTECL